MRPATILLIALLVLVQSTAPTTATEEAPHVLIAVVHPGGSAEWEHVQLENALDSVVDLSGWSMEDGEGRWTFPRGFRIGPGQRAWVGANDTAFQVLWGRRLDAVAVSSGGFCLADRGDGIALLGADGGTVDQLEYGASTGEPVHGWSGDPVPTPASMPWGRLLVRTGGTDTDSATDWADLREPRCGWDLEPQTPVPAPANARCFVTPGEGWDALAGAIASARSDLSIAVYDISSPHLAAAVARTAQQGVRTRLLVEGSPVGATEEEMGRRSSLLAALEESGVKVWTTESLVKGKVHRPYRFHHEKYCVIDGSRVVVTTENWCTSSFPTSPDDGRGSRGWGAVVDSGAVAREALRVFEGDLGSSAVEFEAGDIEPLDLPALPGIGPSRGPPVPCTATLLVGPEAWGPDLGGLLQLVLGARESIHAELAYLDIQWGEAVSPLVEALLSAGERGVDVRLVLDPGIDGEGRDALERLHQMASARGVRCVRGVLASGLDGASRVHAKGAVIDGVTAVLGSLNWARSSVARNREVVLVVEGADPVRPLVDALGADWAASTSGMGPTPPRSLVLEAARGWQGRVFPRPTLRPLGDGEGAGPGGPEGRSFDGGSVLRVAIAITMVVIARTVERRYALRTRWSWWLEDRLRRLGGRLLTPSPRPSSREGAPDVPRTTSPETDRGIGPPPPEEPPRRGRVVILGEVR